MSPRDKGTAERLAFEGEAGHPILGTTSLLSALEYLFMSLVCLQNKFCAQSREFLSSPGYVMSPLL